MIWHQTGDKPLSEPMITGQGTGTETCGIGSVFPSDDLWIGLDTYMNCILIYDLFLKVWLKECATRLFVLTDGEKDSLWWPALSRHWLSWTGCCQYLLNMKYLMYGLLFLQLSISLGCFCLWTFFLKNGLDQFPWTSYILYLQIILSRRIIRSVSGLTTYSPCGVWGRGWTTCLLCDGPILGLCF